MKWTKYFYDFSQFISNKSQTDWMKIKIQISLPSFRFTINTFLWDSLYSVGFESTTGSLETDITVFPEDCSDRLFFFVQENSLQSYFRATERSYIWNISYIFGGKKVDYAFNCWRVESALRSKVRYRL